MNKKIILWLAILVALAGWPISLIFNPPKMGTGLILQLNDAAEEKKLLLQKLGLSTSPLKKIFYNNKTTIVLGRFTKNILFTLNLNNYFFGSYPQTDVTEVNHRAKFVYPALIGFLVGVYLSIKKKTHKKLWLIALITALFVSLFKKVDGWDTLLFPSLGIITVDGLKEIYKRKYGWLILILIIVIGLLEIWRILA